MTEESHPYQLCLAREAHVTCRKVAIQSPTQSFINSNKYERGFGMQVVIQSFPSSEPTRHLLHGRATTTHPPVGMQCQTLPGQGLISIGTVQLHCLPKGKMPDVSMSSPQSSSAQVKEEVISPY